MSTAPVTFRTLVPPLIVMWLWDNEADTPIFRELANERGILRFHLAGVPDQPGADVVRYWRNLAYQVSVS